MDYHYHGHTRLNLFLDTPNHTATTLTIVSLILTSITVKSFEKKVGNHKKLYIGCLLILISLLDLSIALTYSRGGFIAFIAGLIFFSILEPRSRKLCFFSACVFFSALLLIPEGGNRFVGLANNTDKSIINRLEVWKGALAITADHPITGVGSNNFGTVFSDWYQPTYMTTGYRSAINNYLTVSSEHGLFVYSIYLASLSIPLLFSCFIARINKEAWPLGLCAGFVSYLVSSLFTFNLYIVYINTIALLIWASLVWYTFVRYHLLNVRQRFLIFSITFGIVFSILLFTVVTGVYISSHLSTHLETQSISNANNDQHTVFTIIPQSNSVKGVILYIPGESESLSDIAKDTLRSIGERGYIVATTDYSRNCLSGLSEATELLGWISSQPHWKQLPVYVLGVDLGGQIALLAVSQTGKTRLNAVVAIGTNTTWPFQDMSPLDHLKLLDVPVLLVRGTDDQSISRLDNLEYCTEAKRYRKAVTYLECSGGHELNPTIGQHSVAIFNFLDQHVSKNSDGP